MRSPEELTVLFRRQGRKVTPQRQSIFRILHDNPTHPTADAVYAVARVVMPTISLRTVYQTLNDLAEMGEVKMLDLGTGSVRFDPDCGGHHHLVCTGCGAVRDLFTDFSHLAVPEGQEQGFAVGAAEVVFRGLCEDCRGSGSDPGQVTEGLTPVWSRPVTLGAEASSGGAGSAPAGGPDPGTIANAGSKASRGE